MHLSAKYVTSVPVAAPVAPRYAPTVRPRGRGPTLGVLRDALPGEILVAVLPLVFLLIVGCVWYVDPVAYRALIREDGPFESMQFVSYAFAALVGVYSADRLLRAVGWRDVRVLLLLAFGCGCFFIAAEEISWGQRLLQIESGEFFMQHNLQQETTVHNLDWFAGSGLLHNAFILVGLAGGLGWLLKEARGNGWRDVLLADWYCALYFLPTAAFYTQWEYLNRLGFYTISHHQELFETVLSLGFLAVALSNLVRARRIAASR